MTPEEMRRHLTVLDALRDAEREDYERLEAQAKSAFRKYCELNERTDRLRKAIETIEREIGA